MNVPQHIAGYLEDYLDGTLDESGFDILNAWMLDSEANREAFAAWLMNEARLIDASRLADMRAVFQGQAYDLRSETADVEQPTPNMKSRSAAQNLLLIAASVLVALGI